MRISRPRRLPTDPTSARTRPIDGSTSRTPARALGAVADALAGATVPVQRLPPARRGSGNSASRSDPSRSRSLGSICRRQRADASLATIANGIAVPLAKQVLKLGGPCRARIAGQGGGLCVELTEALLAFSGFLQGRNDGGARSPGPPAGTRCGKGRQRTGHCPERASSKAEQTPVRAHRPPRRGGRRGFPRAQSRRTRAGHAVLRRTAGAGRSRTPVDALGDQRTGARRLLARAVGGTGAAQANPAARAENRATRQLQRRAGAPYSRGVRVPCPA